MAKPPKAKPVEEASAEIQEDGAARAVAAFLRSWFGDDPTASAKYVADQVLVLAGDSLLTSTPGADGAKDTALTSAQFLGMFGAALSSSLAGGDEARHEAAAQLAATTYTTEAPKNGQYKIPRMGDEAEGTAQQFFKMAAADRVVIATDAEKNQAFIHLKKLKGGEWVICGWLIRD